MPHSLKPRDFEVTGHPRLAEIAQHTKMEFADYERRLSSLQGVLQLIQQAYLGSGPRAIIVLEGWDTAGKGGIVRRLGWALDPRSFKVHPIAAPDEHEARNFTCSGFGAACPSAGRSLFSTGPGMDACSLNVSKATPTKRNGGAHTARSTNSK
jgi:AMP-polyphosphate phosphotransferase